MKALLITAIMAMGLQAQAANINEVAHLANDIVFSEVDTQGLDWKVGDTSSYNLNMGFIKGTMVMSIKAIEGSIATLGQDLDLGFMGKQNCEVVIDMTNGETKRMTCNGKDQQTPEPGDVEVIEMTEQRVTVPAGTFDCVYIKARQKSQNQEIEQWVNPKIIPISGMAKSIAPSQFGKVTIELTSFKKN